MPRLPLAQAAILYSGRVCLGSAHASDSFAVNLGFRFLQPLSPSII